jgi:hypothetical protein
MKTVTIPLEEYNRLLEINEKYKCLREYLEKANEILNSLGGELGSDTIKVVATKPKPKRTKSQKINDYKKLIESGQRAKKPDHLKKK